MCQPVIQYGDCAKVGWRQLCGLSSPLLCLFVYCQSESLQREILDLQSEFEFDLLDTICNQEQDQAVIDWLLPEL